MGYEIPESGNLEFNLTANGVQDFLFNYLDKEISTERTSQLQIFKAEGINDFYNLLIDLHKDFSGSAIITVEEYKNKYKTKLSTEAITQIGYFLEREVYEHDHEKYYWAYLTAQNLFAMESKSQVTD